MPARHRSTHPGTHRTVRRSTSRRPVRLLAAVVAVACAVLLFVRFGPAACSDSDTDRSTAAEQAASAGVSLYQYNLDRGALALNSYDYADLQSYGGGLYYEVDGTVTSLEGVDVSDSQGAVNWSEVKAAGIDFAFIRIGYRGYTEGTISADATAQTNIAQAKAAGLKVGVYFFSQATTEDEAREEAAYAVQQLDGATLDYPVVYDLEPDVSDDARTKNLSADQATANARAFCAAIQQAGYTPMVYLNKADATSQFDLSQLQDYPLWYAEYTDQPSLGFDFALWQYTSTGSVFGIDGNVDRDILFDETKLTVRDSSESPSSSASS